MQLNQVPVVKTTYGRRTVSNTPRASHQIGSNSSAFAKVIVPNTNIENIDPYIQKKNFPVTEITEVAALVEKNEKKRPAEVLAKVGQVGQKESPTNNGKKGRKKRNCMVDSTRSERREHLQGEIKKGEYANIKHLEKYVTGPGAVIDMIFRVPCPVRTEDRNFDAKRSSWVDWMVSMGFDSPHASHPNICSCDIQLREDLEKAFKSLTLSEQDYSLANSSVSPMSSLVRSRSTSEPVILEGLPTVISTRKRSVSSALSFSADHQKLRSTSISELSIHIPPSNRFDRHGSDDSDSPSTRGCDTTESYQSASFSRPNSSRSVTAPSPHEQAIIYNFSSFSLRSPHHFQGAHVNAPPGTVIPIARAPTGAMNRISEAVAEGESSSRENSPSAQHVNAMSADEDDNTMMQVPSLRPEARGSAFTLIARSSSTTLHPHYTDAGSEENTVIDENDFETEELEEVAGGDTDVVVENDNVVRIVHGVDQSLPPSQLATVHFPPLGESSRSNHSHQSVTFSSSNQTVLFSPIPKAAANERAKESGVVNHHQPVASAVAVPDPLARQPLRRSITEPLKRSTTSSSAERGDVTPGGAFSQPTNLIAAEHHYATPQNRNTQDYQTFLHSHGASHGVIENLRHIFRDTKEAINQKSTTNNSIDHTTAHHAVDTVPDSQNVMDSLPSCMPIPMLRSHSMPAFQGDLSCVHESNGSGHFHHNGATSVFGFNSNNNATTRLSYQGSWKQHQAGEVSLLNHSHSAEKFRLHCAVSSPPQFRSSGVMPSSGTNTLIFSRPDIRRESSDHSFAFGLYCNQQDGRDSMAHSMIGTPPHHHQDLSMVDTNPHHPLSKHHDHLYHSSAMADTPPHDLKPMVLLDRDSGEYKQRLKKIKAKAKLRRMSCIVKPTTNNTVSNQLFESSCDTSSLNMSVDDPNNISGIQDPSLSLSSIPAQSRNRRPRVNTRRRLSMAFSAPLEEDVAKHENLYFPGQKMTNILEEQSSNPDINDSFSVTHASDFDNHKIVDGKLLEQLLQRGVVVGGTFRHEWDNMTPVVVAPERTEMRVDDIRLGQAHSDEDHDQQLGHKAHLSIHVHTPGDHSGDEWVDLGLHWRWVNCNPIGYLIIQAIPTSITKKTKIVFYYLPKHPADWKTFKTLDTSSSHWTAAQAQLLDNSSMMLQDVSDIEGNPGNYFVLDGVEDAPFQAMSSPISTHHSPSKNAHFFATSISVLLQKDYARIFSYLSDNELFHSCLTVNKHWSLLVQLHVVPKISQRLRAVEPDRCWKQFQSFVLDYPRGKFLSDGAFKKVYCVKSISQQRREALSIMDVKDLEERDIENVANVEMEISLKCSLLTSLRICPNMIQVYDMFQAEYDVAVWRAWNVNAMSALDQLPTLTSRSFSKRSFVAKGDTEIGRFQYCQMEFCTGGDVEELVRKVHVLGVDHVRSYLFQMLFAMYAARETLSLRHYDIKLLNFFATSSDPATDKSLVIGFGKHLYRIPGVAASDTPNVVKMADFGTSVVGSETLGVPITVQQFTTLENTPFEFLLLGDSARQSFSSDTFCLGLSFLHLLTGFEPYEVLLKDVRCPGLLKDRLKTVWHQTDPSNAYHVIYMTIQSLQASDNSEDDVDASMMSTDESIHDILCDTLYRFLVLLGDAPFLEKGLVRNSLYEHNPVWKVLMECLELEEKVAQQYQQQHGLLASVTNTMKRTQLRNNNNNSSSNNQQNARARMKQQVALTQCRETYRKHVQQFAIHSGYDPTMQRLRQRVVALSNGSSSAMELLDRLMHFDPAQRCTMYDALHHSVFESLRIDQEHDLPKDEQYLYYYNRMGHSSVDDGLSLL